MASPRPDRATQPFAEVFDDTVKLTPTAVLHSKQYRIAERLGEGGMGYVYRAYDPMLERDVALKVIKPGLPTGARQRFVREARCGARLCHPNIVRVYDLGVLPEQGLDWFAMEYLVGRDLEDLLHRAARRGKRLPTRVVLTVIDRALDALVHAHARGLVHRDVKPANLFVTREQDGQRFGVRLLDFGVALDRHDPADPKDRCGDPRYCPPEQALGLEPVDERADVYAAGITLFEALAGHHPFADAMRGDPMSIVEAHCERDVPSLVDALPETWPSEIREALDAVVRQACSKSADDRFASASAMRHAIRDATRGRFLPGSMARRVAVA